MIFEGIETTEELTVAIAAGASYVQGFLFSRAEASFQSPNRFQDIIRDCTESALRPLFQNARESVSLERYMNATIRKFVIEQSADGVDPMKSDGFLQSLSEVVPANCFRMYICDDRGIQMSANFDRERPEDPFRPDHHSAGCNWSWRPYFVEGLVRMQENRVGVMSDRYIDVDTKQFTTTFSYPLSEKLFLFLDFTT